MKRLILFIFFAFGFAACGGGEDLVFPDQVPRCQAEGSCGSPVFQPNLSNPFSGLESGDAFEWGKFMRETYLTTSIDDLPLPVFLAFFELSEKKEIQAGIDTANRAIGFEVFQVVDDWQSGDRIIYKVDEIAFNGPVPGMSDPHDVVGYTYNRNVYLDGKHDAGRVVTDWAMEIRADHINKWVVAHELGHALGIQKHALIDYEHDTTTNLEKNSLMAASIGLAPSLEDYNYMMKMQGEILLKYMEENKY